MPVDAAQAKSLFLAASNLSDLAERASYLDRECGDEAELRERVEALLWGNDESPLATLDQTVDSVPKAAKAGATADRTPESDEAAGQPGPTADYQPHASPDLVIADRYVLQELIGEGGMGEVWLAKQTAPVKRKVALKLIKAGMDSKAVLARFEQERQALAMMDHPHIARVLDGGLTPTRQPFFVMELVKGLPLTKFCDEAKLGIRERLELFVPICQAVQHAHQKGIVHRDLKPANILVALIDGKPVPKVIDFGVAKATGGKLIDESMSTQFGAVVGTLEYMSPEQAGFSGVDVDTRADVYSLGVILYELLTGLRPTDAERLKKAALTEMIRIVRDEEPSRPSTRLSTDASLPSLAALRQIEPRRLMALLRGDLDWVVMKCLEKQRDRRYETANGLAADIKRYLDDEPVVAGPPSTKYRLQKFIKRNKAGVTAASLVIAALLLGIVGTTTGMVWAWNARQKEHEAKVEAKKNEQKAVAAAEKERLAKREADAKRQEAETNLAFAIKGNKILGSVFEGLDPKADYATVAELRNALRGNLQKAIQQLEGSAIGDPLSVADMQSRLGLSLIGLGEANAAVEVLKKAAETRTAVLGPDHSDTLAIITTLAVAYDQAGKMDAALPLYARNLAILKAEHGPDHPLTRASTNNLAKMYLEAGELDLALPMLEETLEFNKSTLGPAHPNTLIVMNNLAGVYQMAGQMDLALQLMEETLEVKKAKFGPYHPSTLLSMNNLAGAFHAARKLDLAVKLMEDTLEILKPKLGLDHPDTLGTMNNLAGLYYLSGKHDLALPLMEETLKVLKAKLGPNHPNTLASTSTLALMYQRAGKLDLALSLMEKTLGIQTARLGRDHPSTLITMNNLAKAYQDAGKLDLAVPLFEETIKLTKAKFGSEHRDALSSMALLGILLLEKKKYAEAEPLLRECLAGRLKTQPDDWNTFRTRSLLGASLLGQQNFTEAEPLLLEGFQGMKERVESMPGTAKAQLTEAIERLVALYQATNKIDEAAKWNAKLDASEGSGNSDPETREDKSVSPNNAQEKAAESSEKK